jgi:flavin-dependent dehydrogenase
VIREEESGYYEVVVAGGGPAGAAASLALARAGRRVLLLEETGSGLFKIGEVLPAACGPLLKALGVWHSFEAGNHMPCYGVLSAWGAPRISDSDCIFDPNGHGWHLDRPRFEAMLREQAAMAGAAISIGTRLTKAVRLASSRAWQVTVSREGSDKELRCRLLIDATGRCGTIARGQGGRRQVDDALVASFALFSRSEDWRPVDQDSRTMIEAGPDGWWYTALLPSNQRIVAYMTDRDLTPRSPRTVDAYLSLLSQTEHVKACLSSHGYVLETGPRIVAASSSCLYRAAGEGWLAVGDAAISFDPLSSQGLFTALYTGMEAGRALAEQLNGSTELISDYNDRIGVIYAAYLRNRSIYYGMEGRWPERPFWRRRHSSGT